MEIWKDVEGYENLYQISNLGNVRSLNYRNKGLVKNLTQTVNQYGYKTVILRKDGMQKNFKVHRLVAIAFLSRVEDRNIVNHKDGNKSNNNALNLEWCTYSENLKHAYKTGLMKPHCTPKAHNKKVYCEETGKIYNSMKEAAKELGCHYNNISQCCLGKQQKTKNLHFSYA